MASKNQNSFCLWCYLGSRIFGRGLSKLVKNDGNKIFLDQITPYLQSLNLKIVGGLAVRGSTEHDIDIVGEKRDVAVFINRLQNNGINNLVHYCGSGGGKHNHWTALKIGFLVVLKGNSIYSKKDW